MASGSRATTGPERRKYQGYPYVNPPAFGVPTIDPYTATRWANLPRRPIGTAVRVQDQAGSSGSGSQSDQLERDKQSTAEGSKQDKGDEPVVYVDIPDNADIDSICKIRSHENQNSSKPAEETVSYMSDDEPVLYIDLPEQGESDIYERRADTAQDQSRQDQSKTNDEEEPVVYIDIPECSGSGVSERRPEVEDGPSTTVVQETIFYDQFKDRRIDVIPVDTRDSDNNSSSSNNSTMRRPNGISNMRRPYGNATSGPVGEGPNRWPQPPTSLNLWSSGSSNAAESSSSAGQSRPTPTYLPSYLTPLEYQESLRMTPEDEFRLSPLPVTEFPEPPPAYTEIDLRSPPPNFGSPVPALASHGTHGTPANNLGSPGITEQPQRTRVIVNDTQGSERKYMLCQNCRMTVQSIVVKEACLATHLTATCFLIFGCLPCTILVYVTDFCKGKMHYCPNCNKKISKTY